MKSMILFCFIATIFISCSKNELNLQHGVKAGKHQALFPSDLSDPAVYTIICKGDVRYRNECLLTINRMVNGDIFYPELLDFIKSRFGTESFVIQSIEYAVSGESYYLLYDLVIRNDKRETVMFVSLVDGERGYKNYRIDCKGDSCDSGGTCRERFIFIPPSAHCTCPSAHGPVEVIILGFPQSPIPISLHPSEQTADR